MSFFPVFLDQLKQFVRNRLSGNIVIKLMQAPLQPNVECRNYGLDLLS